MVYFKDDITPFGTPQLVILDNEHELIEKGTILKSHDSLIGKFAKSWPKLTNPLHIEEWSKEVRLNKSSKKWTLQATHHQQKTETSPLPTLGRSIIEGKAKWGDTMKFAGEFHYIKGYWEWTEDVLSRCEDKLHKVQIYDAVYASLFTYDCNSEVMKAFCEAWSPSTNTLLTFFGELSISLWDLHILAGLPMTGLLYDEMVPNAAELIGFDDIGILYLPRTCKYLFQAYHFLQRSVKGRESYPVSLERWIKFWSKKATKYSQPPPREEKKRKMRPKSTHNPVGNIEKHKGWTSMEKAMFAKLDIKEREQEETYLAAYLACWLCTFILPTNDINIIRPSTFKMASLMAKGNMVGLAIPVLANIYKGLNKISNFPSPSRVYSTFPVHFVYSWLAYYFKTHFQVYDKLGGPKMTFYSGEGGTRYFDSIEARQRIHKGDLVVWTCNMLTKNESFSYVDNGSAEKSMQNYFMAIRSNYLPWRQGDYFIIEPYSPHRFSRQFGYHQTIPGVLTRDNRIASLDEGVFYWRLCILSKSMSKACLPSMPANAKKFSSNNYKEWWTRVHGNYLEENITKLSRSKPKNFPKDKKCTQGDGPIEDGKRKSTPYPLENSCSSNTDYHWKRQKNNSNLLKLIENDMISNRENSTHKLEEKVINDDEELQYSQGWQGNQKSVAESDLLIEVSLPSRMAQKETNTKQTPHIATASIFEGEDFIFDHQNEYIQKAWDDLRAKIAKTHIDSISSIMDKVLRMLDSLKSFNRFDFSKIEESLLMMFAKAAAYDKAKSRYSERESIDLHRQRLDEAKDRLRNAKTKESKKANEIQSSKAKLECIKKKLEDLKKQEEDLFASLEHEQQLLQSAQNQVYEIKKEIVAIENAPPLSNEIIENLKTSELSLEAAKGLLEDLSPLPRLA